MDKQKNNGHTAPATDEADETMSLFGEKLDAATPCAADAEVNTTHEESPRKESQTERHDKS